MSSAYISVLRVILTVKELEIPCYFGTHRGNLWTDLRLSSLAMTEQWETRAGSR
jgi:hypothetical protein